MFGFGIGELLLAMLVVLLLFGKRLPGTMQSLGTSIRSFREGLRDEIDRWRYRSWARGTFDRPLRCRLRG